MNSIEVIDGTFTHVDAAARVWATATAARDGDAAPPPPEKARPLIHQVARAPGASCS
ncbi:hypothetical protein [Actinopolyspora mortivallis]|uniref:hypothetical protein n=1 Tax=Actinopolyspora mortivallis TaxID=33906 RepID=UPI0015E5B5D3|nr:hypothetical protein [Actinopolyspora mortivallis]